MEEESSSTTTNNNNNNNNDNNTIPSRSRTRRNKGETGKTAKPKMKDNDTPSWIVDDGEDEEDNTYVDQPEQDESERYCIK